jgi:hypothetical protein
LISAAFPGGFLAGFSTVNALSGTTGISGHTKSRCSKESGSECQKLDRPPQTRGLAPIGVWGREMARYRIRIRQLPPLPHALRSRLSKGGFIDNLKPLSSGAAALLMAAYGVALTTADSPP